MPVLVSPGELAVLRAQRIHCQPGAAAGHDRPDCSASGRCSKVPAPRIVLSAFTSVLAPVPENEVGGRVWRDGPPPDSVVGASKLQLRCGDFPMEASSIDPVLVTVLPVCTTPCYFPRSLGALPPEFVTLPLMVFRRILRVLVSITPFILFDTAAFKRVLLLLRNNDDTPVIDTAPPGVTVLLLNCSDPPFTATVPPFTVESCDLDHAVVGLDGPVCRARRVLNQTVHQRQRAPRKLPDSSDDMPVLVEPGRTGDLRPQRIHRQPGVAAGHQSSPDCLQRQVVVPQGSPRPRNCVVRVHQRAGSRCRK